ncbi:MAG: DUF433 domain-containing protein [Planctomycetota bacterium]
MYERCFVTGPEIIDRGDGPKIAATRITVYTVLEYLLAGRTRDWIAAMLNLSSSQVQVAMDYIEEHSDAVNAEYDRIMTPADSPSFPQKRGPSLFLIPRNKWRILTRRGQDWQGRRSRRIGLYIDAA